MPYTTLPDLDFEKRFGLREQTRKPLNKLFDLYITTTSLYAQPVVRYILNHLKRLHTPLVKSEFESFFGALFHIFPIDHPIIKDDVYTFIKSQKTTSTKQYLLVLLAGRYQLPNTGYTSNWKTPADIHINNLIDAIDNALEDAEHKKRRLAWMSGLLRLANNSTRVVDRHTGIGRFVPVFGAASTGTSGGGSAGAVGSVAARRLQRYDAAPAITDDSDDESDGEGAEESKGGEE